MTTHEKAAKDAPTGLCACTEPPHKADCKDCYGFGLVRGHSDKHVGLRARKASEAMTAAPPAAEECPTCHTVVTPTGFGPTALIEPKSA